MTLYGTNKQIKKNSGIYYSKEKEIKEALERWNTPKMPEENSKKENKKYQSSKNLSDFLIPLN